MKKQSIVTRVSDSISFWSILILLIFAYIAFAGWEHEPIYAAAVCVTLPACTDALLEAARKKGISID